jgi:plastocyanin
MRHRHTLAIVLLAAVAACNSSTSPNDGGGGGGGGGGSNTTITVGNDFFSPTPNTVATGPVTFNWASPSNGHTVVWDSGPGTLPANIGLLTSGSRTVTLQPGVYQYHCSVHGSRGSGMHGTITVQ